MAIDKFGPNAFATGSVTSDALATGTIATADIADGSISTVKLANDAVTSAKLDTNIDVAGTLDVTGTLTADSNVSVAGNINLAVNQEINIPSASVDFDIKSFAGAADYLGLRSTYSGSTYTGIKVDYLGRVVAPYGITLGVAESSGYVAANNLDDYEEGTWTPVDNGGNPYTNGVNATYTKIGRIVYFNFDVSSTGSTSGATIAGLPFTSSPNSVTGNWSVYGGYSTSNADLWGHVNHTSNAITMYVGSSNHTLSGRWIGAGFYYTES